MPLVSSSSDDDTDVNTIAVIAEAAHFMFQNTASSSVPRHRTFLHRDRETAEKQLMADYFVPNSKFGDVNFRNRFRMSRRLFLRIAQDLEMNYPIFQTTYNAGGVKGFTGLQKCTSAIRQLGGGNTPDSLDEYLNMSERTSRESLYNYCSGVVQLYGAEYMRRPTTSDIQLLYAAHEAKHGFPGMLGSIDCTHWDWRSCPTYLRGQYMRGDHRYPTIILEAVASYDLWIWHSYFGVAGGNNDLNVLYQSPLFNDTILGTAPSCSFVLEGEEYKHGYYLADGIYPNWATFVKSFSHPITPKKKRFKAAQEAARKDVERAFGVLKAKWAIIRQPARSVDVDRCKDIMYACLILHNMIIQDEGRAICPVHVPDSPNEQEVSPDLILEIRNQGIHQKLLADLVDHIEHTYIATLDH
ncbi:hypothetical protein L2E82_38644 [Cichorium intybus]|uniref:Uncharacterized protein n=1 Tax=Cichorium intybus TaxID=13427 RepID=A0ACB9AH67_CICIN|nr:hypothetical protein L2E82_38644 [Cichorium intybus]